MLPPSDRVNPVQRHALQFYEDEQHLYRAVANFLTPGVTTEAPLLIIATPDHSRGCLDELARRGVSVELLSRRGQLTVVDARDLLSRFMTGALPDTELFHTHVGGLLASIGRDRPPYAYGEMVDVLWRDGQADAAVKLERLWNDLAARSRFDLLCAYSLHAFSSGADGSYFDEICDEHSTVTPAERYSAASADAQAREVARLQQRAAALEVELEERRRFEGDLREALAESERLYAELQQSERRKDEFLATLAHELRNPLAPIQTALAVSRSDGCLAGDRVSALDVIERQVQQMSRLVEDLMDISRVRIGRLELRPTALSVADLVEAAVEISRPLIDRHGHQLTVSLPSTPVCVHGDSARLTQVVANLLNNAAKYTQPGGKITLSAFADGRDVLIAVRDNGAGIPSEMLTRVFEMFQRGGGARVRVQEGLGIGLSLARRIVEAHGGTISVQSDGLGRGSEFAIRLPAVV